MSRRTITAAVAALGLCTVALVGCSSSSDDAAPSPTPTTTSSTSPSTSASPTPSIDPSLLAQANPSAGQAVAPGSIETVEQQLSEQCAQAVAPIREAMKQYANGMAAATQGEADLFNVTLQEAAAACGGDTSQEWNDFYFKEFLGWFHAKPE